MTIDFTEFEIYQNQTITDAFAIIDQNTYGAVFVMNDKKQIIGIATDGDIRRWLIKNPAMDTPISKAMNTTFVSATTSTPREQILKTLDHKINIIPVLGTDKKLVDVITRSSFPLRAERRVLARAKAPVRISFSGGGSDLTHYFMSNGGAVMNAAISMYSHSLLRKREDSSVRIYSHDLKVEVLADNLSDLYSRKKELPLIISLIQLIKPNYGFELQIGSDFPMSSGLGGSAVVLASIIGCFNQFREDRWDNYEIAEMAFQAERLHLAVPGGWQDQYATVFGGFNFMEFTKDSNVVHPLRVGPDLISELEECFLLCHTGKPHDSGAIHTDQKAEMQKEEIQSLVAQNKDLTYKMKTLLLRGKLSEFGKSLHEGWLMKRQFSKKISNNELDGVYELALSNGASGGKLLGAGGGGYFLFYARPAHRYQLEDALTKAGYKTQRFTFDDKGLQAWTVRDENVVER